MKATGSQIATNEAINQCTESLITFSLCVYIIFFYVCAFLGWSDLNALFAELSCLHLFVHFLRIFFFNFANLAPAIVNEEMSMFKKIHISMLFHNQCDTVYRFYWLCYCFSVIRTLYLANITYLHFVLGMHLYGLLMWQASLLLFVIFYTDGKVKCKRRLTCFLCVGK